MRVRLAPALAVALATVFALAAPVSAGDFVGMYNDDAFFGSGSYRSSVFAAEAATGVELVRQPFDWRRIEVAPGDYDFRDYDDFVLRAAAAGVHVLPVLGSPPSFRAIQGTSDDYQSPPRSNADFADFAAKLVRRYGPGGSVWAAHPEVPALPIRSWQIWNEPNLLMFWNTGPDPAEYAALLRAAHDAIHTADPGAEVVAAGLPQSRAGIAVESFLDGMFRAGASGAFDTAAVHPYARSAAGSVALVELTRAVLTAHNDDSPVWVTEVGWPTGGPTSPYTVTEAQQALEVSSVIAQLGARRDALGVRGVIVFRWRDAEGPPDAWPMYAGLVRADGTLKPAVGAFSAAVAGLNVPAPAAPLSQKPATPPGDAAVGPRPTRRPRVAIRGGELSRYGFLRVHLQCLERPCGGRLRAGRLPRACSGQRRFKLGLRAAAVVRLHLKATRKQVRRCRRLLVTATTGPADPPAAAYLPKKPVR